MPSRHLTPHKSTLPWKIAFNTATDFETALFSRWVQHDPNFSIQICLLHELLLEQGLDWEAARIRAARERITNGDPLPPEGPPLVFGDGPPSKALPPFDREGVEVMECSDGGEYWYQMRREGGRWHRRTAEQLWPKGRPAPVGRNPAAARPLGVSASAPAPGQACVAGRPSQSAPSLEAAAVTVSTGSSRATTPQRLRGLALGRGDTSGDCEEVTSRARGSCRIS